MAKKRWTEGIVIASIQRMRRSKPGKLNSNYVQRCHSKLYLAACRYFGGWKQAVEAAGIDYGEVRVCGPVYRVWNKTKVVAAILGMYRLQQPINSNYVQLHHLRLYGAAVKHFGGWGQAVEAAGIDYTFVRRKTLRSWKKDKIVEAIRTRKAQGLSVNGEVVSREDPGLYKATRRHFGKNGYRKALRRAGINPQNVPDPRRLWTKEKVAQEILSRYAEGLPLNIGSLQKRPVRGLVAAARKLYGSWRRAIQASGLRYAEVRRVRINWWTPARVIHQIRRLEKAGILLSSKSIQTSEKRGGFFAAALRHFGCWSQAVEAAGIDYRLHARIWSTKAWVRKLGSRDVARIKTRIRRFAR